MIGCLPGVILVVVANMQLAYFLLFFDFAKYFAIYFFYIPLGGGAYILIGRLYLPRIKKS